MAVNILKKRRNAAALRKSESAQVTEESILASVTSDMEATDRRWVSVLKRTPSLLLPPILVLIVILASGLVVAFTLDTAYHEAEENKALSLAEETGQQFAHLLDQALLPLFSLAQFVSEVDAFSRLNELIGPSGEPGSLPFQKKLHSKS